MSIKAILEKKNKEILSIESEETIIQAVKKMNEKGVGSIVVLNRGELEGIFTERDLLKICAKDSRSLDSIQLKEVMTKSLTVASIEDDVDDILATMLSKKFRHMPVMEGNKLIGLISIGDAVKQKYDKTKEEVSMLRQYMYGGGAM